MTEQEKAAVEAGKSTSSKTKERSANSGGDRNGDVDFSTLLNFDVSADHNAGRAFVDRRVKAFGEGMRSRLKEVQGAMSNFDAGEFVIEATYERPLLPPSPEETQKSVLSLLFGSDLEVEEDGQG